MLTLFEKKCIPVEDIVHKLTDLPVAEKSQHKYFIKKNLKELEQCTKHKPVFSRLNEYWNYLSPQLLYHLVRMFPSLASMMKEVELYDTQLFYFRNLTLLRLFCEVDSEYIKPPEGFTEIVVKFESHVTEDPTLQHVEDFREKYARHHQLRDFALMLVDKGEIGSFIVSFTAPNCILQQLVESIPTDIFKEFGVIQLKTAEYCIFSKFMQTTKETSAASNFLGASAIHSADDTTSLQTMKTHHSAKLSVITQLVVSPLHLTRRCSPETVSIPGKLFNMSVWNLYPTFLYLSIRP